MFASKNRISKYFINLERLVKIPVNDLKNGFQLQNGDENTIAASYFPEWFYCSSCNKFDKISNWKYNWLNNVEINHRDNFFLLNAISVTLETATVKKIL